jgi:hypothetical protein
MSNNEIHGQRELTAFETEELRIRQKELDVKLKELELQKGEYKLRRAWFRNPTIISGFVLAYVTGASAMAGLIMGKGETERKYALEYTKLAVKILESPSQQHELTEWASGVLRHFADAPFDVRTSPKNPEASGQASSYQEQ